MRENIAELRVMTDTVINPDYDRRCSYGYRTIGEFPIGTVVAQSERVPGEVYLRLVASGDRVSGKAAKLVVAASKPTDATTFLEWLATTEADHSERTFAWRVLDRVWAEHPGSREALKQTIRAIYDE